MEKIDDLDRQILNIITKNARIPFKDIAEDCDVSRAAIHQRVQRLIDTGVEVVPSPVDWSYCFATPKSMRTTELSA